MDEVSAASRKYLNPKLTAIESPSNCRRTYFGVQDFSTRRRLTKEEQEKKVESCCTRADCASRTSRRCAQSVRFFVAIAGVTSMAIFAF